MKKLNYITISLLFIILSGCNLFLGLPLGEKIQYFSGEELKDIFIDESDNGIIVFKDKICKIKNLSITNEKVDLKDTDSNYPISNVANSVDKSGNGIMIYSRENYDEIVPQVLGFKPRKPYYLVSIENNKFITNSVERFFSSSNINIKILNLVNSESFIYYLNNNNSLILNYINNNKITKGYQIDKELNQSISNIEINIDEKGNGGYSYNDLTTFNYFSLNEFKKEEEKLSIKFRDETDTKTNYTVINSFIDSNGTGYLIIINNRYEVFVQKFENFKEVPDKKLILNSVDLAYSGDNYQIPSVYLDKEGNGAVFLIKKINIQSKFASRDFEYSYLYIKKVKNFKLEDKEIKVLDSNKFNYYNFAINEKGNGLVVLNKNNSNNTFIIKKIRNFEPEK